jgi:hypothetical protein
MARPNKLRRFFRHLATDQGGVRRAFPEAALARIEALIGEGEKWHRGQVRFSVEASLPLARVLAGITPRERAIEAFSLLRIWDTEENCGVLVYLLLADRDVEIIADRGIHERVGSANDGAPFAARWKTAFSRTAVFVEGPRGRGSPRSIRLLPSNYPRGAGAGVNELPTVPSCSRQAGAASAQRRSRAPSLQSPWPNGPALRPSPSARGSPPTRCSKSLFA